MYERCVLWLPSLFAKVGDADDGVDGHDDENDEKGVEHGDDRVGEGGDDALELGEAGEDVEDAEDSHDAEEAEDRDRHRKLERAEGRDGQADDDGIPYVHPGGEKLAMPVGVDVDEELDGEQDGEDCVSQVDELADTRSHSFLVDLVGKLSVDDGDEEVDENQYGGAHLERGRFVDYTDRVLAALDSGPSLLPLTGSNSQLIQQRD